MTLNTVLSVVMCDDEYSASSMGYEGDNSARLVWVVGMRWIVVAYQMIKWHLKHVALCEGKKTKQRIRRWRSKSPFSKLVLLYPPHPKFPLDVVLFLVSVGRRAHEKPVSGPTCPKSASSTVPSGGLPVEASNNCGGRKLVSRCLCGDFARGLICLVG